MDTYVGIAFGLIPIGLAVVAWNRVLRGLLLHVFLILLFHAVGALLLRTALEIQRDSSLVGWVLGITALDFHLGALVFVFLGLRDRDHIMTRTAAELIQADPIETVILEKRSLFWGLVYFLGPPGTHTIKYAGGRWIRDAGVGVGFARVILTTRRILVEQLFPRTLLAELPLSEILTVGFYDQQRDLVSITYRTIHVNPAVRLIYGTRSGGTLLLNLRGDAPEWEARLASTHSKNRVK